MTFPGGMTVITARTGIHCGNELESGRKISLSGSPRDDDVSGFKRFTEYFQNMAIEFGQFIQEKNAMMCQRDFAWTGCTPASDQGDGGSSMVRGTKRSRFPSGRIELATQGLNGGRFNGFLVRHGRQYSCKT